MVTNANINIVIIIAALVGGAFEKKPDSVYPTAVGGDGLLIRRHPEESSPSFLQMKAKLQDNETAERLINQINLAGTNEEIQKLRDSVHLSDDLQELRIFYASNRRARELQEYLDLSEKVEGQRDNYLNLSEKVKRQVHNHLNLSEKVEGHTRDLTKLGAILDERFNGLQSRVERFEEANGLSVEKLRLFAEEQQQQVAKLQEQLAEKDDDMGRLRSGLRLLEGRLTHHPKPTAVYALQPKRFYKESKLGKIRDGWNQYYSEVFPLSNYATAEVLDSRLDSQVLLLPEVPGVALEGKSAGDAFSAYLTFLSQGWVAVDIIEGFGEVPLEVESSQQQEFSFQLRTGKAHWENYGRVLRADGSVKHYYPIDFEGVWSVRDFEAMEQNLGAKLKDPATDAPLDSKRWPSKRLSQCQSLAQNFQKMGWHVTAESDGKTLKTTPGPHTALLKECKPEYFMTLYEKMFDLLGGDADSESKESDIKPSRKILEMINLDDTKTLIVQGMERMLGGRIEDLESQPDKDQYRQGRIAKLIPIREGPSGTASGEKLTLPIVFKK